MWEKLVSVLQRILSVYEEVLALSEKKNAVLRNVAVRDMETILRSEQTLIKEIGKWEQERLAVSQKIAETEHHPMDTIAAAITFAAPAGREELKAVHDRLRETLRKIAANNRENDALTRQSLELMQYKINILTEIKVEPTYAEDGHEGVSASKWFDYKA